MITYKQFLEEALKRSGKTIEFIRLHHGSDKESIESIKKSGPKASKEGSEGPGHYVTPSRKKAEKYAEIVSTQRNKEPGVVSYRVQRKSINTTSEIPKKIHQNKKTTKEKPVIKNTKTGHAAMDPDYASRTMIRNPSPIIRRKKKK